MLECTPGEILRTTKNSRVIYPMGKPRISRLGGISQAQPTSPLLSRVRRPRPGGAASPLTPQICGTLDSCNV